MNLTEVVEPKEVQRIGSWVSALIFRIDESHQLVFEIFRSAQF